MYFSSRVFVMATLSLKPRKKGETNVGLIYWLVFHTKRNLRPIFPCYAAMPDVVCVVMELNYPFYGLFSSLSPSLSRRRRKGKRKKCRKEREEEEATPMEKIKKIK